MKFNLIESLGLPTINSGLDLAWRDDAACRGQNPETFLPEGKFPVGSPDYRTFVTKATAFCEGCSVADDCLEFGMTQKLGIYGGTTSSQRAAMRRTNREIRVVDVIVISEQRRQ